MDEPRQTGQSGRLTSGRRVRILRFVCLVFFLAALGVAGVIGGTAGMTMLELTSTVRFCSACHEMEVFRETWAQAPHGSAAHGSIAATCVECHLPDPEEGIVAYFWAKGTSGTKDIYYHLLGHEPDWVANLERHEAYTYESGCRQCHVELVAPGVPLKAITAHRDYEVGQTTETCIGCHAETGHGDLRAVLEKRTAP